MTEMLIRRYYEAYNAIDAAALADILDPDVTLTSAGGTENGRDAYLATFRYMTATFTDRMEPLSIAVNGNVATVQISDTLTALNDVADFLGQSLQKGQEIVLDLVGRYTVRDNRIVAIEITAKTS